MKNENYLIINSLLKSTLNLESNKSNLISYISQKNPSSQLLSQIMSFFNKSKSKPIEEMNIEEVCKWLLTLGLTQDYSSKIRDEGINGEVLVELEENEWKDIFPKMGDRKIVKKRCN